MKGLADRSMIEKCKLTCMGVSSIDLTGGWSYMFKCYRAQRVAMKATLARARMARSEQMDLEKMVEWYV